MRGDSAVFPNMGTIFRHKGEINAVLNAAVLNAALVPLLLGFMPASSR